MRLFVIDDNAEFRKILIAWFRRRGHHHDAADDGQLRKASQQTPASDIRRGYNMLLTLGPRFNNGEKVYEKFPIATEKRGTIVKTYVFADEYRYVINFEDGREAVLFEKELVSGDGARRLA